MIHSLNFGEDGSSVGYFLLCNILPQNGGFVFDQISGKFDIFYDFSAIASVDSSAQGQSRTPVPTMGGKAYGGVCGLFLGGGEFLYSGGDGTPPLLHFAEVSTGHPYSRLPPRSVLLHRDSRGRLSLLSSYFLLQKNPPLPGMGKVDRVNLRGYASGLASAMTFCATIAGASS